MDARKHLIIIKGKDQTDSVASFQFHDGKCEVVYISAPNKTYSFQNSNVEILHLKKKIDPAQVDEIKDVCFSIEVQRITDITPIEKAHSSANTIGGTGFPYAARAFPMMS